jgi:hypothetical protein
VSGAEKHSWRETAYFAAASVVVVLTLVAVVWMLAFLLALIAIALGFVGIATGGRARNAGLGIVIGCALATVGYVVYMTWF